MIRREFFFFFFDRHTLLRDGLLERVVEQVFAHSLKAHVYQTLIDASAFIRNATLHEEGQRRFLKSRNSIPLIFDALDVRNGIVVEQSAHVLSNIACHKHGVAMLIEPRFKPYFEHLLVSSNPTLTQLARATISSLITVKYVILSY